MNELGTSDERGESSQLLGQSQKHLVLVVDGVRQEGNELGASPLDSEGKRNGRQLLDGVQAKLERS